MFQTINTQRNLIDNRLLNKHPQLIFLDKCNLNNEDIEYLIRHKQLQITTLKLKNNRFDFRPFQNLQINSWKHLVYLDISCNNIANQGCKYITKPQWNIKYLFISQNRISISGILHLSKSNWPHLQALDLHDNRINQFERLIRGNWAHLHTFNLQKCKYTNQKLKIIMICQWQNLKKLILDHISSYQHKGTLDKQAINKRIIQNLTKGK